MSTAPSSPSLTVAWRFNETHAPVVHCWAGEYAVFNPLSGKTHILDTVAGELLARVGESPASGADLCSRIAGFLDVADDEDLKRLVAATARRLEELGLIEQTP